MKSESALFFIDFTVIIWYYISDIFIGEEQIWKNCRKF